MKELIELRRRMKSRKPIFTAQDSHKRAEIPKKWKKPKGIQSKMRLRKKGYRRGVSKGWRSPKAVRGLHKLGLIQKLAFNKNDIESINPEKEGVVIAKAVGGKKRLELLELCTKKNIRVLNVKDPVAFIQKYKDMLEQKRKEKKEKTEAKKKKSAKKESKEDKSKAKGKEEELSEKEKREQEKKEKDRLLIQKTS